MSTNATEARRRIARHGNLIRDLEVAIAELESRRTDLLASWPEDGDHRPAAARHREELAEIEAELSADRLERGRLADSVEVVRASLPSPAEVAAAEARAAHLAEQATEAAADALDQWTVLAAALADLYEAAHGFLRADAKRKRAVRDRRDAAEAAGILDTLPALELPQVTVEERRAAAALLAGALTGGAHDDEDKQLKALLDPLRVRLAAAEGEGEDGVLPLFQGEEAAA